MKKININNWRSGDLSDCDECMGMARKTARSGLGTVFLGNGSIPLRHSPAALSAS